MEHSLTILEYLPEIMEGVQEFRQLSAAENPELEGLWQMLEEALHDQFVEEATDNGLKRWERILEIMPKGTDSPDERRFRILMRLNEQLPFSWRRLCEQLEVLCGESGYSAELKNEEYTLMVKVALTVKSNFTDVANLLGRVVPANLAIDLTLKYNQHGTLSRFTHGQLSAWSHEELRSEVIV